MLPCMTIIIVRSAISVLRVVYLINVDSTVLTITRSRMTHSKTETDMNPLPMITIGINALITKPYHHRNM